MARSRAETNPQKDPYTQVLTTDPEGNTPNATAPVGSYQVTVQANDSRVRGRVLDILGIGDKQTSNILVAEGQNPPLSITVSRHPVAVVVEPGQTLSVSDMSKPLPQGAPAEVRCKINLILPRQEASTKFTEWYYLFYRARPTPHADFEIELVPEEGVAGGAIKTNPGTVILQTLPAPPARWYRRNPTPTVVTVPRLRVIDGKHTGDRDELDRIVQVRINRFWNAITFGRSYTKNALVIQALFTNEEFRHLSPGRYAIRVRANYDNKPFEDVVGHVEFVEGERHTMVMTLERLQPQEDHLPADGKSLAWYRITAAYTDANPGRVPHGLQCQIHLASSQNAVARRLLTGNKAKNTTSGVVPTLGGAPDTYVLNLNNGSTEPFAIKALNTATTRGNEEEITLIARMMSAADATGSFRFTAAESFVTVRGRVVDHDQAVHATHVFPCPTLAAAEAVHNDATAFGLEHKVLIEVLDQATGAWLKQPEQLCDREGRFSVPGLVLKNQQFRVSSPAQSPYRLASHTAGWPTVTPIATAANETEHIIIPKLQSAPRNNSLRSVTILPTNPGQSHADRASAPCSHPWGNNLGVSTTLWGSHHYHFNPNGELSFTLVRDPAKGPEPVKLVCILVYISRGVPTHGSPVTNCGGLYPNMFHRLSISYQHGSTREPERNLAVTTMAIGSGPNPSRGVYYTTFDLRPDPNQALGLNIFFDSTVWRSAAGPGTYELRLYTIALRDGVAFDAALMRSILAQDPAVATNCWDYNYHSFTYTLPN